jgi:hypothetical protein
MHIKSCETVDSFTTLDRSRSARQVYFSCGLFSYVFAPIKYPNIPSTAPKSCTKARLCYSVYMVNVE